MTAQTTEGAPRLLIDARALASNLRALRRATADSTVKIIAVVKANAYGHDARLMTQLLALIEEDEPFNRVDGFAVVTVDEAAALGPVTKPVMLLRPIDHVFLGQQRDALEHAIRAGWTLTLANPAAADDVGRIAAHLGMQARVQLMLDTGMVRCGVAPEHFDALLERTLQHASLALVGICTHLVCGEIAGDPTTVRQLRLFQTAIDRHPILESVPKHVANSGATFMTPRAHFDAVRPGIALYGIDPTGRPNVDRTLTPVMKWTAPILVIHDVPAGGGVGYNHTWTAPAPARVAMVPVGYADGFPRLASNRAVVMVNGTPCGVVGRVSMDSLTIDITRAGEVCIGDEVTLVDNDPLSPASIYQLARAAETIPYEILTRIGPRILRVPVGVEIEALPDAE